MSSRALRKFQREQEVRQKNELQRRESDKEECSGEDREETTETKTSLTKKSNAFDLLNTVDEDEDNEDNDNEGSSISGKVDISEGLGASECNSGMEDAINPAPSQSEKKTKSRQRRKNKKKKKQGSNTETNDLFTAPNNDPRKPSLDEIDAALLSLRAKNGGQEKDSHKETELSANAKRLYTLLATDSKNLNSINEMKRLFGNAVLSEADEAGAHDPARRRGRGPQHLDLGGALAGRNSPISRGQGLAGLALRRNIFMQGKEEWPKATSGGLGMDVVEHAWDFTTEYKFVHNSAYQDVQKQFETCVESLDPQRMVQLLQFNRMIPHHSTFKEGANILIAYHISTLLQVSEIAKQQGDQSVSGDLLERALFSFGRSVHSSFHTTLAQGEARLDFRYRENREFFLASWRYVSNLGQRGTWRTAYEWAKLLLSLDPEGDPYEIRLVIDQLALRGGQAQHFLDLATTEDWYQETWESLPNIHISKVLAEQKLKRPVESRATLRKAISSYPWIFSRLFQELNLDPIPKSIWGKKPRTDHEKFESEMYVTRAKDLWNTPEATSLLVEVANSIDSTAGGDLNKTPISLNEARHVLLADIPTLIGLLPRTYTTMRTSAADPLPPSDDIHSYMSEPLHSDEELLFRQGVSMPAAPANGARDLQGLQTVFSRIAPWLGMRRTNDPPREDGEGSEGSEDSYPEDNRIEEIIQAINASGVPATLTETVRNRVLDLQQQLRQQEQELRELEQSYADENALEDETSGTGREGRLANLDSAIDEATANPLGRSQTTQGDPAPSHRGTHAPTAAPAPNLAPEPYNEERNQRWLVGQGMQRLAAFTREHGTNESVWLSGDKNEVVDSSPVLEYLKRVRLLKNRATRNVILEHHLHQGAGAEVRDLIKRLVEREDI